MGFLRQKQDGSTSLAILTPTSGILPGTKELPISLGALSGKLTHGTAQVQSFKEDKKNMLRIGMKIQKMKSFLNCDISF
jgi:bromodomain-containing protein 7/9